jgi:hypothetical protein
MITAIEFAVKNVHRNATIEFFNKHDWLPSILLTFFAQGHTAVTALHLGRLAISALQDSATAPRTWAELFWLADGNWQSPLGVVVMLMDRRILRMRISSTIILFILTVALALPLPIMVSRAYPLDVIQAYQDVISTNQTTVITLNMNKPSHLNVDSQMAVGRGARVTNLDAQDVYSSRIYMNESTETSQDMFYSGDLRFNNATLPGVLVRGDCHSIELSPDLKQANSSQRAKAFTSWCSSRGLDQKPQSFNLTGNDGKLASRVRWCTAFNATKEPDWMNQVNHTTTVVAWFDNTDQKAADGVVNCTSTFTTGQAFLVGVNTTKTYHAVKPLPLWNTSLSSNGSTLFYPPLYASFFDLSHNMKASDIDLPMGSGYDAISDQLWRSTAHMAAAISLLSSTKGSIKTQVVRTVAGRTRDVPQLIAAGVLLLLWLFMMVFLTFRMFRRTFGSALNSYAAARLVADMPELMQGHSAGELAENERLGTRFARVGDANAEDEVGKIQSGGSGALDVGRQYG